MWGGVSNRNTRKGKVGPLLAQRQEVKLVRWVFLNEVKLLAIVGFGKCTTFADIARRLPKKKIITLSQFSCSLRRGPVGNGKILGNEKQQGICWSWDTGMRKRTSDKHKNFGRNTQMENTGRVLSAAVGYASRPPHIYATRGPVPAVPPG